VNRSAAARQSPPVTRFELRRRRNRQALIEAAIDLFQQRGIRGAKLEDICAVADVAPRTFFNHFETREHLYAAIAEQRAEQSAAVFDAVAEDPRPIGKRLPELFGRLADYLAARPLYRELVAEMLRIRTEGGSEVVRNGSLGRAAERLIASGVARGEITDRIRSEVLADLMLGAINIALANWSASSTYPLERELRDSADALLILFTKGLRASARAR
jgi:AcrR family transcriptional regulator